MNLYEWAKNEVEIAKKERKNEIDTDFDGICACYDSALKAFKTLCDDGHSGTSIEFTQIILNRLIEGKILTPIEDTDDIWDVSDKNDEKTSYRCKRMTSLFKDVYLDGTIKYMDVNRYYGIDEGETVGYSNGLCAEIVDETFPIIMPYYPPATPYRVVTETFLFDPKNGDFDTRAILYIIDPDGKKHIIERYFAEKDNGSKFTKIDKEEYEMRKKNKYKNT